MALEDKSDTFFNSNLTPSEFRHMKVNFDTRSDLLALCILLAKIEAALGRATEKPADKDKWDLDFEEFERLVSVEDQELILDEEDADVVKFMKEVSWEQFEEFIRK